MPCTCPRRHSNTDMHGACHRIFMWQFADIVHFQSLHGHDYTLRGGTLEYDPPQQLSHHNYTLRGSGPLSYDPAFKLAHHDYKLRGHGYDVVYPNDISPDDDNGEA